MGILIKQANNIYIEAIVDDKKKKVLLDLDPDAVVDSNTENIVRENNPNK